MEQSALLEKLYTALRTEVEGHAFYKYAAELTTDENGKRVFEHLAKEELEHIDVIAAMAESIKAGKGWMSYEEAVKAGTELRNQKGLPLFPEKEELAERLKGGTDTDAVQLAIDSEDKAVGFYSEMLKQAKTPEERVFLTKLLEMEKMHLKILRWEYESLLQNGFWCDFMEYSVEKESE